MSLRKSGSKSWAFPGKHLFVGGFGVMKVYGRWFKYILIVYIIYIYVNFIYHAVDGVGVFVIYVSAALKK